VKTSENTNIRKNTTTTKHLATKTLKLDEHLEQTRTNTKKNNNSQQPKKFLVRFTPLAMLMLFKI